MQVTSVCQEVRVPGGATPVNGLAEGGNDEAEKRRAGYLTFLRVIKPNLRAVRNKLYVQKIWHILRS